MSVKAAAADFERIGQGAQGIGGVELFHHRETLRGISADKMPKAFFKISRCWRRYSFSWRNWRNSRCAALSDSIVDGAAILSPALAFLTHSANDQADTPRSRETSPWLRPPSTSATAFCLNARSYRRPNLLIAAIGLFSLPKALSSIAKKVQLVDLHVGWGNGIAVYRRSYDAAITIETP